MKKIFAVLLAFALLFAMGAVFTACGNDEPTSYAGEETTELTDVYVEQPSDAPYGEPDDEPGDETSNEPGNEPDDEPGDAPGDEAENPFAPPENLGTLSQAAQLEYFNAVANRVRDERPGFHVWEQLRIDTENMSFSSGLISVFQSAVNAIITRVMPGEPETQTIAPGADNRNSFMSLNPQASTLRMQDISSIRSTRQGENWVIEIRIREEVNPRHGTGQHARVSFILDREEIIDLIISAGPVTVDPANVTVTLHSGFVRATVNANGQIIAVENGADVRGEFTDARIAGVRSDGVIPQTSRWRYSNFVW